MARATPVGVGKIFILKVSASITCAPELMPVGDSRLVMAWMPCNVPARTRYSFEVICVRPSSAVKERTGAILSTLTSKIALIDKTASFIYHLFKIKDFELCSKKKRRTHRPKMAIVKRDAEVEEWIGFTHGMQGE